jgi:uncharacterized tellurite resistance protein B-like protein
LLSGARQSEDAGEVTMEPIAVLVLSGGAALVGLWMWASNHEAARAEALRPVASFAGLARFIASADRRIGDAERLSAAQHAAALFPALIPGRLTVMGFSKLLDASRANVLEIDTLAAPLRSAPEAFRRQVLDALRDVSEADGRTTKAETERLAIVASRLGIEP